MLNGKNGNEILDDILKRAGQISLIPATPNNTGDQPQQIDIDPVKLAEEMKKAARQLGDGESFEPTSHKNKQEPLEQMGEPNTDPVTEAAKGPELSSAVKQAVLEQFDFTEKDASASGAQKAMAIGLPLAGLGAGYVGGRLHGQNIDRKNNQAYYEAGVYDAARRIAARITAQQRGKNE